MLSTNEFQVVLHGVGRNLNRAYRTCEAFGVTSIRLHQCDGRLAGHLYRAAGRVALAPIDALPTGVGVLALETGYPTPLWAVPWESMRWLLIGGETCGLPRKLEAACKARIMTLGNVSGLTVEAALAIALYERSRCFEAGGRVRYEHISTTDGAA